VLSSVILKMAQGSEQVTDVILCVAAKFLFLILVI
jgi:hypothetical protein